MPRGVRRQARRRALELLYEADLTGAGPTEVLMRCKEAGEDLDEYSRVLVSGVEQSLSSIDAVLERHAHEWSVARMPSVDRAALRLATFELLTQGDVPTAVAIDEAVGAVSKLSTDESGKFVNGVLAAVAKEVRT